MTQNGNTDKFKARNVAKKFKRFERNEISDTFAHTSKLQTFKIPLVLSGIKKFFWNKTKSKQLIGNLKNTKQPKVFESLDNYNNKLICKFKKQFMDWINQLKIVVKTFQLF